MTSHNHRTALITGASRGLGLALARGLADRSWNLIVDARGAAALESARAELAGRTRTAARWPRPRASLAGLTRSSTTLASSAPARSRSCSTIRSMCLSKSTASTCLRHWRYCRRCVQA
jgi:NAD(P)-dependent dehydrogenase (short-subunit alcohol dehydrogenase family)